VKNERGQNEFIACSLHQRRNQGGAMGAKPPPLDQ